MVTLTKTLVGDITYSLDTERNFISAIRKVGEGLNLHLFSLRRKTVIYLLMLASIQKLLDFQAICFSCAKFAFFRLIKDTCDYRECPIHDVYVCGNCDKKWDMTNSPEDIDFLIMYNRRVLFEI